MNIIFGVTGGISAYKTPGLISVLVDNGHHVVPVVTKTALDFVTETSLSIMAKTNVVKDLAENDGHVKHIELCEWCDLFVIVPCSANMIGKMANGIADDALSTIHLALPPSKKKLICPAMNTHMWENLIVQRNVRTISGSVYGYRIIPPIEGKLACGGVGIGKLPGTKEIIEAIESMK